MSVWWGAVVATLFAAAGRHLHWLTSSGAVAAAALGTAVLSTADLSGAVPLGIFFLTGSLLTRWNRATRPRVPSAERSASQIIANGWTALLGAALVPTAPMAGWTVLLGGLATAQADTWATEIGARARREPALITSGKRVPAGTSGGVTTLGTVGGMAGAALMATAGWALGVPSVSPTGVFLAGTLGMVCDSMLGATVQGRYHCDACDTFGETPQHACGTAARRLRGCAWIGNDAVNALATGCGAALALGMTLAS